MTSSAAGKQRHFTKRCAQVVRRFQSIVRRVQRKLGTAAVISRFQLPVNHDAQVEHKQKDDHVIHERNQGRVRDKLFGAPEDEGQRHQEAQNRLRAGPRNDKLEGGKGDADKNQWDGGSQCPGKQMRLRAMKEAKHKQQYRRGKGENQRDGADDAKRDFAPGEKSTALRAPARAQAIAKGGFCPLDHAEGNSGRIGRLKSGCGVCENIAIMDNSTRMDEVTQEAIS